MKTAARQPMLEHEFEPIPGLPEQLPEGERVLWQGAPTNRAMALDAYHVRAMAVYGAIMLTWNGIAAWGDGMTPFEAFIASLWVAPLPIIAVAILVAMAWASAKTTLYTITNRRVVMKFGVALPMMVNLPFNIVKTAEFRENTDSSGDVTLQLMGRDRIAYLHLWPHVRRWHFTTPQPMLRGIPAAREAAGILAGALADYREAGITEPAVPKRAEPERKFAAGQAMAAAN